MAIRVELELEDGTFTSRMIHAGETLQQFNQNVLKAAPALVQMRTAAAQAAGGVYNLANDSKLAFSSISRVNESSRSFLATLRDVTIVLGLARGAIGAVHSVTTGWAAEIIKVNSEIERMTMLMRSMSSAVDPMRDAKDQVAALRQMALDTPFALSTLTGIFTQMKSTGIDPMKGAMRGLTDAVAAFGGSDEVLKRAALAMQQMSGKGVIQMEELRQQLGEAVPRATELMARAFGITYAQLVKDINTGTVQAKPALAALNLELERTYGGAALQMMQTFQGQLTKTRTLLQNLALEAGNAGYFDAVKKQLTDINNFLSSPMAMAYAKQLGEGLTTVVNGLRSAIDFVIKFRNEMILTAEVVGAVWAGGRIISGIGAVAGALQELRSSASATRVQMAAAAADFVSSWAQMRGANVFGPFVPGVAVVNRLTGALGVATGAMRIFALTTATVAPWLPLIAGGVLLIGNYFELFTNRARDAWQELDKFGAKSKEQVETAAKFADRERARLDQLKAQREYYASRQIGLTAKQRSEYADASRKEFDTKNDIPELERRVAQYEATIAKGRRDVAVAEQQAQTKAELAEVDKRIAEFSSRYDRDSIAMRQAFEQRRNALLRDKKSTETIDKEYADNQKKLQVALYDQQIAELNKFIATRQAILDDRGNDSSPRKAVAEEALADATKRLNQLAEQRLATMQQLSGSPKLEKEKSIDTLLEKAGAHLNKLKAEAEDYKAEMAGAQGETAKLAYQLEQAMRYGDPGNDRVKAMIEQLIQAQDEAAKLHDALQGKQQMDRDIASSIERAKEEIRKLGKDGESDYERIIEKFQTGGYGGYNPQTNPLFQTMENVRRKTAEAGNQANLTADIFRNSVFGTGVMTAGNDFLSLLDKISNAWATIRGNVNGTNFAAALASAVPFGSAISGAVSGLKQLFGTSGTGIPASIRNNNPGAMWPGAQAARFGSLGYEALNDGQGNKIARFATPEAGAAANMALLAEKYVGMTLRDAIAKWSGGNDVGTYLSGLAGKGFGADTVLTPELMKNQELMTSLLKAMAQHEAGRPFPMSDAQWGNAFQLYLGGGRTSLPTSPVPEGLSPKEKDNLEELKRLESLGKTLKLDKGLADQIDLIKREILEASDQADGFNKHLAATNKLIASGKLGDDKDPQSARYKELIKLAKEWDDADNAAAARKKARSAADSSQTSLERQKADLLERQAAAQARLNNPLMFKNGDTYFKQVRQLEDYVQKQKEAYGADSENYRQALATKESLLAQYQSTEYMEFFADLQKKTFANRASLESEQEQRELTLRRTIDQVNTYLAAFKGSADERMQIEKVAQEYIRSEIDKTAQKSPIARQMKEWKDLSGNFEKSMTGWLDSSVDALTQLATTGKADWKSLLNSVTSDLVRMSLKWSFSSLFGGASGKMGGGAKGGLGKSGTSVGVAHTGGILGRDSLMKRLVDPGVFSKAPRFHTGGIIGSDEVPIIARRGEGVFTPEQMSQLGGGVGTNNVVTIAPAITLNAQGGTKEQNQDLADQFARQIEPAIRGIVVKELMVQRKPNGLLRV